MKKLARAFTHKMSVGRFGVPVWALGVSILLTAAATGQAVGPGLSGTINGRAAMVIGQSVGLSTGEDAVHRIIGVARGTSWRQRSPVWPSSRRWQRPGTRMATHPSSGAQGSCTRRRGSCTTPDSTMGTDMTGTGTAITVQPLDTFIPG